MIAEPFLSKASFLSFLLLSPLLDFGVGVSGLSSTSFLCFAEFPEKIFIICEGMKKVTRNYEMMALATCLQKQAKGQVFQF